MVQICCLNLELRDWQIFLFKLSPKAGNSGVSDFWWVNSRILWKIVLRCYFIRSCSGLFVVIFFLFINDNGTLKTKISS